jgi:hypothetical protein
MGSKLMQNLSAREVIAIALTASAGLLIGGSRIYGVLYLPPSEQLSVWPIWVVALVPAAIGIMLLRRGNRTVAK